jgi:Protein of unknown function (DUF2726)
LGLLILGAATAIILLIAIIVIFVKPELVSPKDSQTSKQDYSYKIRGALLTPAEIKFHKVLKQAVDGKYIIFAKVRVADILTPADGLSKSHWQRAFNKISAKHFDFVLCNSENLKVEMVIELDDKSHLKSSRIARDNFLNQATNSSGLKFLRFQARSSYQVADVQSKIL